MAKVRIEEIPPVPVEPAIKVILELDLDEAVFIASLCSRIGGCGETRNVADRICRLLKLNGRIKKLCDMSKMGEGGIGYYVGHCAIPKE